jgi:hypothetical protein
LMACTGLTGDYWRARHDKIKLFLFKLMRWGRMEPSLEVANIFARKISTNSMNHNNLDAHGNPSMTWQENWNSQPGRTKQAYVPDLTFILQFKEVLAEIKTLGKLTTARTNDPATIKTSSTINLTLPPPKQQQFLIY